MLEELLSFRPGLAIALVSLAMLAGLLGLSFSLRAQARRRQQAHEEQLRQARLSPKISSNAQVDAVWSEAIKSMESLQSQLRGDLNELESNLKAEREVVESKTEGLKKLARESRIPLTLYELYEGMRYFSKKDNEARQSDREWHAKVGITDIDVIENNLRTIPGREIHFRLENDPYLLVASHHQYSRTHFVELTLFDLDDNILATVRVQPDSSGQGLAQDAVISMRQGPWFEQFLSCRAKMDVRHREISLLTEHRDVLELKEKFAIQSDNEPKLNP